MGVVRLALCAFGYIVWQASNGGSPYRGAGGRVYPRLGRSLALPSSLDSERVENGANFHPLMGGNALQNDHRQSLFDLDIKRDRHSLKTGIQGLKPDMSSDLLDEMVVPMPAQAGYQIVARNVDWRCQAANTN